MAEPNQTSESVGIRIKHLYKLFGPNPAQHLRPCKTA